MSRVSNRDLAELATLAATDLAELCAAFRAGLGQRLTEAEPGPAASTTDRGGRSAWATHADPTASAALSVGFDLAGAHRAELAQHLVRARAEIARALAIAASYPPAHPAGAGDRLALGRLNAWPRGCSSCARLRSVTGVPRWEPLDARWAGATDVGGRLAEPQQLCRWCVDRVIQWGRLPTVEELELHHRGGHVPWPTDVPRPA